MDSTPKLVTKLDILYTESSVIANGGADISPTISPTPRPQSPKSVSDVIVNTAVVDSQVPWEGDPFHQDSTHQDSTHQGSTHQGSTLPLALDPSEGGQPSGDVYRVTFDFDASSDHELALKAGDLVTVVDKTDNGWWKGLCDGRSGWFPETYVEPATMPVGEEVPQDTPTSYAWEGEAAGEMACRRRGRG